MAVVRAALKFLSIDADRWDEPYLSHHDHNHPHPAPGTGTGIHRTSHLFWSFLYRWNVYRACPLIATINLRVDNLIILQIRAHNFGKVKKGPLLSRFFQLQDDKSKTTTSIHTPNTQLSTVLCYFFITLSNWHSIIIFNPYKPNKINNNPQPW